MSNTKSKIHWLLTAMLLVAAMLMPMGASASITPSKPTNGDGSSRNPYQISTAEHLYWFAGLVNGTITGVDKNPAACAKLTANITVNRSVLKSDGTINSGSVSGFTVWTPIGYYNSLSDNVTYTGTFDGNGKTISGLYYNDDSKMYVGLFGYSSGTIKNVGVIDTYFHCNSDLGGICGYNYGTVSLCYSKSYLYGKTYNVGGVCGVNYTNATITNCYHIGTIYDWEPQVGGVCGYNYGGNISYCYHIGNLENANTRESGSICGKNTGKITKCYYNKDICSVEGINRADADGQAEGKTTAQFSSGEMAMVLQGSQSGTVWGQTIGSGSYPVIGGAKVNYGYPVNDCFRGYTNLDVTATPNHASFSNGFCSRCNGYQMPKKVSSTHHSELNATHNGYYAIENAGQFYWFAALVDGELEYMPKDAAANAVLTTNITVNSNVLKSDGSLNTGNSVSFRVMPIIETNYSGTFDGNGYTIGGLCINDTNFNNAYLFTKITKNGKIKNLGIVDSYMKIGIACGWFCAKNEGLIINCYNKSTVISNQAGVYSTAFGICGDNFGRIERCYNTGSISGYSSAAGVCINNCGVVVNCYNTGDTQSELNWGYTSSLVCSNAQAGSIANCYSAGSKIIGPNVLGSICSDNQGKITNCYYDKNKCSVGGIRGSDVAGQAEGKTTAQFKSGEVAHLLAKTRDTWDAVYDPTAWGQELNVDDYPLLGGRRVYSACTDNGLVYANYFRCDTKGHKYDNGFCKLCDAYEPAQKVSSTHHPELNTTHNGYYAIENAGQLYWLSALSNGTMTGITQNLGANAVLTNNITVNENVLKADGTISDDASTFRVWTPIGYYDDESFKTLEPMPYIGHFDGNGKTVSGLYYDLRIPDTYFIGLFGCVGKNNTGEMIGNVTNVGVVDSYFNGREDIAGICGVCIGANISNCYSSATVVGTDLNSSSQASFIAGVCGFLIENGSITNCYNTGKISGTANLGGICGAALGTITNCYNTGDILGENSYNGGICGLIGGSTVKNCYSIGKVSGTGNIGGVLGGATDEEGTNTISNCYYDNETCMSGGIGGADVSGKATGKSSAQFSSGEVAYLLSKGAGGSIWGQKIGTDPLPIYNGATVYYGYSPDDCNKQLYSNTTLTETPNHTYDNGFCTICNGYQPAIKVSDVHYPELISRNDGNYAIENAGQLYWYASQVNNYPKTEYTDGAVLVADITVNEGVLNSDGSLSSNSSNFRPWTPIGYWTETDSRKLYGMVDGNGHIISGLYCNDANKDYTGLVGYGNCTIKNLGLVDTYFKGKDYVGSICAYNVSGNIQDCYSVSNVSGTSNVGSICGYNYNGTITNCYYDNEKCSTGGVNGADVSGQTVGKATDKFHNGEVAYLLAYVDEYETWNSEIWGQQLGTDPYPVGSAYKLIPTALKKEDNTYWATFSDQGVDATLSVPSGRTLNVYNATVSGGTLTLSKRNDCQVAVEEGVLLKTDGEYVNIKANEDYTLTPVDYAHNNLVATRSYAETIIADEGYTLYRLTYNNSTDKTGLGFYLSLVKGENGKVDETSLGKKLKATPGKAYLKVATEAATNPANAALARSFVFPGDDETTGIGEIVIEGDAGISGSANANDRIYNLQGQQVTAPVKGLYIKNNKKVIIK